MRGSRWKTAFGSILIVALPLALGCEPGGQDGPPGGQGQPPSQQQGQQPPGQQPPAQPQTMDVSEDELETFAEAYLELDQVRADTEARLEEAEGAEEQGRIEQEANSEMQEILDDHGMTVQEYQQIAQAINTDPELRAEFEQILQEESGP